MIISFLSLSFFILIDGPEESNSSKSGKNGTTTTSADTPVLEGEYSKIVTHGPQHVMNDSELTLEERLFLQSAEAEKPTSSCLIC